MTSVSSWSVRKARRLRNHHSSGFGKSSSSEVLDQRCRGKLRLELNGFRIFLRYLRVGGWRTARWSNCGGWECGLLVSLTTIMSTISQQTGAALLVASDCTFDLNTRSGPRLFVREV